MNGNVPKTYDPKAIEKKWYDLWWEKGYFKPSGDEDADKFSIAIPPPNVTSNLHMGHALEMTWHDILIRYKRQQGANTAWLPGIDHAGIATQRKVRDTLRAEEGLDMHDLGREKFVERLWEWKHKYSNVITNQVRSLGASCDWSQERFTMDKGCSKAVREVFVSLCEKGLIYRGNYIVNWCPECETTLSDIEVEHEDRQGKLWHVAYKMADGSGGIVVATTRPETILGDVAIAVNPKDERYKNFIGKECIIPLVKRRIPIIADNYVDMEFGTGAVKVTPAHDSNDFEIGLRHDLPKLIVMHKDATMNENAGPYAGMNRYECRKAIIADLEKLGTSRGIEEHSHAVGQCYRCDTIVEPVVMKQWFVKMKPLAERTVEAVEKGEVRFVPERFKKIYLHWMENIRDWCISRQIWWGHSIPAWYCTCGEVIVSREEPTTCPCCGSIELTQDQDVLDTWFSSALWPFSIQGWPNVKVEELEFYPTSVVIPGYDILFFWVARMLAMGLEFTGTVPFREVLLHGLVRDSNGRKMSKSLGNGVDPLEVIDKYGADTLRFTLVTGNTPGHDLRFREERLEASRNFANKIWNAARFVLMNLEGFGWMDINISHNLNVVDKWMLSRYNTVVKEVARVMEKYEFGEAVRTLYDFLWSEFCDWYIEMAKPRLYGEKETEKKAAQSVLCYVLSNTLRLLHPFMPFITEELWQALPHEGETIMIGGWPQYDEALNNKKSVETMNIIMNAIRSIRNIRQESNVKPGHKIPAIFAAGSDCYREMFEANKLYISSLSGVGDLRIELKDDSKTYEQVMTAIVTGASIYLPLAGLVDIKKEIERLTKEKKTLESEIERADAKLTNKNFVEKAPAHLVEKEKEKLKDYQAKLAAVASRLKEFDCM